MQVAQTHTNIMGQPSGSITYVGLYLIFIQDLNDETIIEIDYLVSWTTNIIHTIQTKAKSTVSTSCGCWHQDTDHLKTERVKDSTGIHYYVLLSPSFQIKDVY